MLYSLIVPFQYHDKTCTGNYMYSLDVITRRQRKCEPAETLSRSDDFCPINFSSSKRRRTSAEKRKKRKRKAEASGSDNASPCAYTCEEERSGPQGSIPLKWCRGRTAVPNELRPAGEPFHVPRR